MKDLYSILECSPSDGLAVIKKKYRQLAQQFHPDKNPNNKYAEARFHDIKEAYEILTDPHKKEIWLQERWLHQVLNKRYNNNEPLTPLTILKDIIQLENEIYNADKFRLNYYQYEIKLDKILSDTNIKCLTDFKDNEIQFQILVHLLKALKWFPYDIINNYKERLFSIASCNINNIQTVKEFIKEKNKEKNFNFWKVPIIIICTIIICFFIILMSR